MSLNIWGQPAKATVYNRGEEERAGRVEWVEMSLLFNEAIPASTRNRATWVGPPAPIVIERLLPVSEVQETVDSTRSSFSFTTLSEERLQAAVKLAKRDLRRRRLESLTKSSAKPSQEAPLFETSDVEPLQSKASSPKEKVTQAGAKQHTFQKHPLSSMPRMSRSPPTRDPGLKQVEGGKEAPLNHEIHKLQNELEVYIQKVEELANRGSQQNICILKCIKCNHNLACTMLINNA
uniref:Uncharacterized protein n=1 Tax=Amphilophus citrinellus TaxID=61819 RepID=A0A3Q0RMZ9_AMPCI